MSTDFFYKKFAARLCFAFFLLFMGSLCFFTVYFQSVEKVSLSLRYYYLVQEEVYTEAGALTVYNEGGASYFLESGNNQWIALAVYTKAEDAQSVLETLSNHKTNLCIVEKGVNTLYFKGIKEKDLSATYVNGLKAFDGYIRALEECIYRLDKGLSQEKTREILLLVKRQLRYNEKSYQAEFNELSKACKQAQERLGNICNSVIMAKDLRYLVCEMAEENIAIAREFVL